VVRSALSPCDGPSRLQQKGGGHWPARIHLYMTAASQFGLGIGIFCEFSRSTAFSYAARFRREIAEGAPAPAAAHRVVGGAGSDLRRGTWARVTIDQCRRSALQTG
jgi:hypothetical protein